MDGLIAGLAGAMQGGGQAMQQNAQLEMKQAAEISTARSLEQIKADVMREREARVADIIGKTPTTIDDATHPEGKRAMTGQERAGALAKSFEEKGLINEAKSYRGEENALRDDARQAKHYEDEAAWRMERARIEDEFRKGQITHQQAMERIQAGTQDRLAASAGLNDKLTQMKLDEAQAEAEGRGKVRGLINAASNVDVGQPGGKESKDYYRKQAEEQERANLLATGKALPGTDHATSAQRAAQWLKIAENTDDPAEKQAAKENAAAELRRSAGAEAPAGGKTRVVNGKTFVEVSPGKWQEQSASAPAAAAQSSGPSERGQQVTAADIRAAEEARQQRKERAAEAERAAAEKRAKRAEEIDRMNQLSSARR